MIQITKELLKDWFNNINSKYFNGELRTPSYVISNNRSRFGQFRTATWTIEMSTAFVRSERDYMNTFLHEICHLYVRQKYGRFAQPHGYEWKSIANEITRKTNRAYGIIKRVGGGQDKPVLRNTKSEKFVVFTDYNGHLSIAKYRDDKYVSRLKESGGVMDKSTMYFFTSDNAELNRYRLRKVNTNSIRWTYSPMTLDEIKECSTLIKSENYNKVYKLQMAC